MGFSTTNPESQNTGMDTTHPISSIASSGCFGPTSFTTISASFSAAPVASRNVPIMAPKMITIPMLVNVDENPLPITVAIPSMVLPSASVTAANGIPPISPSTSETSKIERNGWILNLLIITIMTTIATTNTIKNGTPVILYSSFYFCTLWKTHNLLYVFAFPLCFIYIKNSIFRISGK